MTDTRPRCSHHVVFPDANCPECMRAEIERLRAENIELRNWRDTAVANCGKRRCSERDAEIQRMTEKVDEIERLRALLAEARGALLEVRAHLHAAGRRPEHCYEMSVIDAALRSE